MHADKLLGGVPSAERLRTANEGGPNHLAAAKVGKTEGGG